MSVSISVGNRPEFHNRLSVFINRLIIDYLIAIWGRGKWHLSLLNAINFICLLLDT